MSSSYQVRDSYFMIVDPLSVIMIGMTFLFLLMFVLVLWKKRNNV
ncbi:hypothetical protein ACE1MS_10580 [Lysinibacillus sp. fkY74-1]|uniref:Uncharacterized protein n=2 Tax=Lysinibacillus TaxID=400634 RepID=W7S5B2_LYSSH|nr:MULTISPECIES: hypothetical protein [Lysinibacillus]EWH33401.1 hypothetical protein P799_09135 [Lysinibacillus sphaericus CBAM5]MCS1396325.1 hypothetical protein [Lysinibacillus sp. PB211]MDR0158937.1 hypothetical protein [Lysinibacillus sphaericus]